MAAEFSFGKRKIGIDHPPLVVAEAGINHNGSLQKAKQLVDAAVEAGCEAIKFQTHIAEKEMIKTDVSPDNSSKTIWEIIKEVEMDADAERQLQEYCAQKSIYFFSTPFSKEAADRLAAMDMPVFKIPSGGCNNLPLLDHVASFKKPIILSTGMSGMESIARAVAIIKKHGTEVALLHCVSIYPTPYEKVGLGCIDELRRRFPGTVVGLSDHSDGIWTCLGSVALGASMLEKHFTVSADWEGPDIGSSITPPQLRDLVIGAEAIWRAGGGEKKPMAEEQAAMDFAFASLVTTAEIKQGEKFTSSNTWAKRPGGGIPAAELEEVLGKTAARDLAADIQLARRDIK